MKKGLLKPPFFYLSLPLLALLIHCDTPRQSPHPPADPVHTAWARTTQYFDNNYDTCIHYCRLTDSLARLNPEFYVDYIVRANVRWADQTGDLDGWDHYLSRAEVAVRNYGHHLNPDSLMHTVILMKYDRCRWIDSDGNYDRALNCYRDLWEELPQHLPDEQNFRVTLPLSIGWVHYVKGDYKSTIEWTSEAFRHLPADNNYYRGYLYDFLGKAYFGLGDLEHAEENFRRSIREFSKDKGDLLSDNSVVEAYTDLVHLYTRTEQFDSCLAVLKRTHRLNLQKNWGMSLVQYQFANTYSALLQYDKALAHIDTALAHAHSVKSGKYYTKGRYLSMKGEVLSKMGKYQRALDTYQLALYHLGEDPEPQEIRLNPNPETSTTKLDLLITLSRKASTLRQFFEMENSRTELLHWALGTYESAVELIRLLRTDYSDDETKELLSQQWFEIFESAIETAMHLNRETGKPEYVNKAFSLSETSKGLSLLENLTDLEAKSYTGIPTSILEEEYAFKMRIGQFEKSWREAEEPVQLAAFRDSLFVEKRNYEQWQKTLRGGYPDYFQLKFNSEVVSARQVQRSLSTSETLVEYFYGEKKLYVFAISSGGIRIHSVELTPDFSRDRENFTAAAKSYRALQNMSRVRNFQRSGYRLYRELLEPLAIRSRQIILVPDGPLSYLPFAALTTDTVWQEDPGTLPYLIRNHTLATNFSASVRLQQRKYVDEPGDSGPLLILSPENFPETSNLEIDPEALKERFRGNVRLVRNPTKLQSTELLQAGYQNIFLFTHAAAHEDGPFLQLFRDTLFLSELYATPVRAKLVLLGACETGLGENRRGEGVLSLARGFAYQNVPNTVMTLWKVRESAALEISLDFLHLHLNEGLSPAAALRQAQLAFLRKPGHIGYPSLWAGFVTVGE